MSDGANPESEEFVRIVIKFTEDHIWVSRYGAGVVPFPADQAQLLFSVHCNSCSFSWQKIAM